MREFIQNKLNELTDIDSGNFIPDEIVEIGKTYFGYTIQSDYISKDNVKNNINNINIIGYVVRRNNQEENTLSIIDEAVTNIINKLEEMNFKCSWSDVTITDLRKIKVTANVTYNEIRNELV